MAIRFGVTLKAIRTANDMSVKEAAAGLGVTSNYICDCEGERKNLNLSIKSLEKMGEFYKFPCYKIIYVAELQTEKKLSFAQTLFEVLKCYQETKEEEADKYAQFTSEKGL